MQLKDKAKEVDKLNSASGSVDVEKENEIRKDMLTLIHDSKKSLREMYKFLLRSKQFHELFQQLINSVNEINSGISRHDQKQISSGVKGFLATIPPFEENKLKNSSSFFKKIVFKTAINFDDFGIGIGDNVENIKIALPLGTKAIDDLIKILPDIRKFDVKDGQFPDFTIKQILPFKNRLDHIVNVGLSNADRLMINLIPVIDEMDRELFRAIEN